MPKGEIAYVDVIRIKRREVAKPGQVFEAGHGSHLLAQVLKSDRTSALLQENRQPPSWV